MASRVDAFARFQHDPPAIWGTFLDEKNFDRAVAGDLLSPQPSRDDFGIIQDQYVGGTEKGGQI